jgi:uncharacterized protein YbcC (UPF0753/DUF2309 family)
MADTYLKNSDQNEYGRLMAYLHPQQSLQNDKFPKIVKDATNVFSTHKFDNIRKINQETNKMKEDNEVLDNHRASGDPQSKS